jgi:sulfopyruvate decarboxylase subunit alpha
MMLPHRDQEGCPVSRFAGGRRTRVAILREEIVDRMIDGMKEAGINFVCGLPDGWLNPLHSRIEEDPFFQYVCVPHEGIGVSICAGAWLGGKTPMLVMENSGLRTSAETIARICMFARIPILMMISYRGDVGETEYWAVQHGILTEPLLQAFRIPYRILRSFHQRELETSIVGAVKTMNMQLYPVALVIGGELT